MVRVASGFFNFLSLTHLNLYEEKRNQRAPPMVKKDYTERVEIVPCDDGWPAYEETVVEF